MRRFIDMQEQLKAIQEEALQQIRKVSEAKQLQDIQVAYLGRSGSITKVLRGMGKLPKEERPVIEELANKVRQNIQAAIDEKKALLEQEELERRLQQEKIDVTLTGRPVNFGGSHIS